MLSQQRQRLILDLVKTNRSAQVTQLSASLGVSLATVRRDLSEMEEQGLIQRVHGGAILVDDQQESPLVFRAQQQADEKRRIGRAAAALVQDGETILITGGTTTEAMLPFLADKNALTVITNVVSVAYKLLRYPQISVIVLGGWLRHSESSLLGHLTMQALTDLRASKTFQGAFGIDPQRGLTGVYLQEVDTDRKLIEAGAELIVVADSSKFNQAGPILMAPIERVSHVVTDSNVPEEAVHILRAKNIRVTCA